MQKRFLPLLFWPLALLAQQPRPTVSAGDLYKTASPSVVLIETYGEDGKVAAKGSGFIIAADGVILTNYHVVAHTKRATVRLANDDAYDYVGVLDVDKRKDRRVSTSLRPVFMEFSE
jgi:S1-C subfamily serine protease